MSATNQKLLIIRPEPRASEDAAFFKERGVDTYIAPVLAYEDVAFDMPDPDQVDALIITSARAVAAIRDFTVFKDKPLYCVGTQSAQAAQNAGFQNVRDAKGTATDLMAVISAQERRGASLLYPRGEIVSVDVSANLVAEGFLCESRVVYSAIEQDIFDKTLRTLIERGDIAAVGFYSQRSAALFIDGVKTYGLEQAMSAIKALCISRPVIECVRVLPWADILLSQHPDGDAMRALSLHVMRIEHE